MNILNLEGLKTVGQVAPNTIINADCLEAMKYIADKSIDCIICDLPYGITACKWDTVIPFEPLWEQYKRIVKPRGAIVLFGSQPFTSALVMSNPKWFKYEWTWNKKSTAGFVNTKNKPMNTIENICVFSEGTCANKSLKRMNYYPQGLKNYNKKASYRNKPHKENTYYRKSTDNPEYIQEFTNYPRNYIEIPYQSNSIHPTQKPVALIEYFIKTYTLKDELILDNTAGSGTLAIAAINTDRNYICIEKDEHYFEVMRDRIERHDPNAIKPQPRLPKKKPISNEYIQLSLFNDCLDGL